MGGDDDWPQTVVRGFSVVALSPGVIEHLPSADNGMSGGPVLDQRGALLGLVMGHNHGIGRVASVEAIRWIIDDSLPACRCRNGAPRVRRRAPERISPA